MFVVSISQRQHCPQQLEIPFVETAVVDVEGTDRVVEDVSVAVVDDSVGAAICFENMNTCYKSLII